MNTQATALRLPWQSDFGLVQAIERLIARVQQKWQVDRRIEALTTLLLWWEDDIRQALRNATPADLRQVAVELGGRNLTRFNHLLPLMHDLLRRLEPELGESLNTPASRGWESLAERCEELLPHLSPAARRDIRAAAILLDEMLSSLASEEMSQRDISTHLEHENSSEEELLFLGLLQCLGVLGTRAGWEPELGDAAALEMWRLVRLHAPEELVEDAYLASEAAEAQLAGAEDDVMSLEGYLAKQTR